MTSNDSVGHPFSNDDDVSVCVYDLLLGVLVAMNRASADLLD